MVCCLRVTALAAPFYYDESIDGPLSGNVSTPTILLAGAGENVLIGHIDGDTNPTDYFTFTAGETMPSVVLDYLSEPADFHFALANQPFDWHTPWEEFLYTGDTDQWLIGHNLLDALGLPALPASPYFFAIGVGDGAAHDYRLTFTVAPEANAVVLLVLGWLSTRRRRRS